MTKIIAGNMRVDGDLITIVTCCAYDLVRLVANRLQPWKRIARYQASYIIFSHFTQMLSNGQIIVICNIYNAGGMQRRKLYLVSEKLMRRVVSTNLNAYPYT